ncbi:hypothetical protein, unlikely [Trypanosoma brucei gambiense DAL972]|uniref:Uncharacterized protein n=1 Tax=Trypanosoma brucei gambiense (strain MHOM/CI/86/DAL972) TaxID=679716 RepID=C9ZT58_TRYB9|nr:hypothetical protein, unlikely [Trypanosoma brucei gambiense DAL972]CBH12593.1 hypothetical protein, unlikely [Trypanosoma brucei gambiense DAL972]|eukprot:XP_011774873.1 hypothetical protein, unlikely [Trypanosoma brucei gambiense DAL972]
MQTRKKKLTTKRFKSFVRRAGKRKKKEGFRNLYREWRVEVVGCYYREGDYMCLCLYLWVCFLFVFLFSLLLLLLLFCAPASRCVAECLSSFLFYSSALLFFSFFHYPHFFFFILF